MKKYEIMFIINPTILEEGRDAVIEKVTGVLTAAGANIQKSEKWGERKLAYPIDKKKTGFYVLTTFEIDGTVLSDVELKLNIIEEVLRYIIVKQD
ncbi:30S ribosomal protein S6 [Fusobacterium mortiferum]|jgi:small subunit ribosomal protein S6|uniref:Small ribosomal subunit protein bS6 n=2 Tax=Fusobacterium mortiferum TaxID=850 RepID=A0A414PPV5_FUSMR|nr:30S ribosomal protein S6 [Fusobacterium mortiferum]AVQ18021.1 30S ribosomal protein S6 [Fusobacterium mortiferum ATCC 9817]EEO36738.1 ribosomal protein S6 [Fusobacterium mortiferum ATCC 9817]MCF2700170.1 30S ribosomal protein S6 [Fusobacterium mortiferum]MCI7666469.1 30S ribosomal protein S6 [Fusobacterium mortiferum]MDD7261794.1 30S ribosomal protein S6 [Fusobacterium mortiferum]